jgi:hypothetical protein
MIHAWIQNRTLRTDKVISVLKCPIAEVRKMLSANYKWSVSFIQVVGGTTGITKEKVRNNLMKTHKQIIQ